MALDAAMQLQCGLRGDLHTGPARRHGHRLWKSLQHLRRQARALSRQPRPIPGVTHFMGRRGSGEGSVAGEVFRRTVDGLVGFEPRRGACWPTPPSSSGRTTPRWPRRSRVRHTEAVFERALIRAQEAGEMADRDPRAWPASWSTPCGLRVLARVGTDRAVLEDAVRVALDVHCRETRLRGRSHLTQKSDGDIAVVAQPGSVGRSSPVGRGGEVGGAPTPVRSTWRWTRHAARQDDGESMGRAPAARPASALWAAP